MMIYSRIKAIFYSVEFTISVILVVIFMATFKKSILKIRRFWAKSQRFFGLYKIEIIGNPSHVNMIIMNHKSMLDIVVMEEIYPGDLSWVAKKEIGEIPIIGQILKIPKMIPIDRSNSRSIVTLIKDVKDRILSGRVIAIFPEGTRTKGDKLLKFQSGAKVLVEKLNLKVQPVVIVNSDILDVKNFSFKNGTIKVIYLNPVDTSNENWFEKTRNDMQDIFDKYRKI